MHTPQAILDFWFGHKPGDAVTTAKDMSTLWWSKDEGIDRHLRERFLSLVQNAVAGDLVEWESTPCGRLALILLTDQFPRNVYRGTSRAFAYDELALSWCLDGLAQRVDTKLLPIQRCFFYLPLEHCESLEQQDRSVALYAKLMDDVSATEKELFEGYLRYAIQHRDVVARFGRFPHRNEQLGRESTLEELDFLLEPGSSF